MACYVDYGEAWEMISSSSPPLTLVALDGLFLKKATNSNKWVPMIIGHDTNIPEFTRDSSLESEISIWHILDIYKLLSYEMDSSVVQLLNFVCECIWIEDGNELTENLMHAFRNLDAPDVPERNDAKLAKRHRIKQSAARIRDIMLTILAQISSKQIRRSEDVIKQAFHSAFKQIDRSKLETFILKSMSRANQIKSILNSEFGLDIFFGKQAVAQNYELVVKVVGHGKLREDYEWSDKIFEDEEDALPFQHKSGNNFSYVTKQLMLCHKVQKKHKKVELFRLFQKLKDLVYRQQNAIKY